GHEHRRRHLVRANRSDDTESVDRGHLHVEKHQIGLTRANGFNRRGPIGSLDHFLHRGTSTQQARDSLTRQRFVVNYENPHRCSSFWRYVLRRLPTPVTWTYGTTPTVASKTGQPTAAGSSGRRTSAMQPPDCGWRSVSVAAFP